MLRRRLQTSHVEMGGQNERRVCREIKKAKDRDEQLGPEDVFSSMPLSEGLKMLVSTMMTGHDDGNHVDGPFEMARKRGERRTSVTGAPEKKHDSTVSLRGTVCCLTGFADVVNNVLRCWKKQGS